MRRTDLSERRAARMAAIDQLPPETRALVHEYGWAIIDAFLAVGVKKPKQIKHLIETVLNETRGESNSFQSEHLPSQYRVGPAQRGGA